MSKYLFLVAIIFVSGCTGKIPYLVECPVDGVLRNPCDAPVDRAGIDSHGKLKEALVEEERRLTICQERHKSLLEVIDNCNSSIVEFNKKVKEINKD